MHFFRHWLKSSSKSPRQTQPQFKKSSYFSNLPFMWWAFLCLLLYRSWLPIPLHKQDFSHVPHLPPDKGLLCYQIAVIHFCENGRNGVELPLLLLWAGSYPLPCSADSSSGGPGIQLPGEEEIKWQVHCWLWILLLHDHPHTGGRTLHSEESMTIPLSFSLEQRDWRFLYIFNFFKTPYFAQFLCIFHM